MRTTARRGALLVSLLAACSSNCSADNVMQPSVVRIDPALWQQQAPSITREPAIEARVAELLARMTLEEKVGQIIQADISAVTPAQARQYHLGFDS